MSRNSNFYILDANNQDVDSSMSLTTEMLLSKAKVLENCTETMAKFINDQEGLNDTIIQGTDKQKQSAKDVIKLLNSTRSAIEAEEARGGDPSLVQNLTGLTEKLCDLANDFLRASEEENGDAVPSLKERKNIFMKENTKMITQLIAHANVPSIHKRGPGMMKQAAAMNESEQTSILGTRLKQAHTNLEVTKAQLQSTQEQADEALEKQLEVNRRLQENLMQLAKFTAEGKTHGEIMEVLQQGLKAFGQLKQQWTKLLLFFQSMSNLINTSLGPPLKGFVEHANLINNDLQEGFEPSEFCRELIYQPAKEAVKVIFLA